MTSRMATDDPVAVTGWYDTVPKNQSPSLIAYTLNESVITVQETEANETECPAENDGTYESESVKIRKNYR